MYSANATIFFAISGVYLRKDARESPRGPGRTETASVAVEFPHFRIVRYLTVCFAESLPILKGYSLPIAKFLNFLAHVCGLRRVPLCFLCDDARFCRHRRSPDFHDSFLRLTRAAFGLSHFANSVRAASACS